MRTPLFLSVQLLACAALFSLALSAWANAPLPPPRWVQPYAEGQEARISFQIHGTTWSIFLIVPGPCDYTCALYGPDSDSQAAAAISGSLEAFGPQLTALRVPLKPMEKGKSVRYRLSATGNYYRYKKVPASAEKQKPFRRRAFGQIIGDPNFRYELIDKQGNAFSLEERVAINRRQDGSYSITSTPGKDK